MEHTKTSPSKSWESLRLSLLLSFLLLLSLLLRLHYNHTNAQPITSRLAPCPRSLHFHHRILLPTSLPSTHCRCPKVIMLWSQIRLSPRTPRIPNVLLLIPVMAIAKKLPDPKKSNTGPKKLSMAGRCVWIRHRSSQQSPSFVAERW